MSPNYFLIVSHEWKRVLLMGILAALLAALLSFLRPLEYSSTIRLLVIQRSALGLDPYTAIRSAERVSENLANIVYTTSFFEKVMASGFSIDQNVFSSQETKRRNQWRRMVDTQVARGTGLLTISVYHRDREQAKQIASAIGAVLQLEGWTYVGGGDLQIRIVDTPLSSRYPVRPNIPLNAFTGLILGIIGGVGYVIWLMRHGRLPEGRGFLHELN
ncbi:hypothetical protein HY628_00135 [Candidatus Uhrbacteria bacterium]|nr:hypothetical protein [Candidatus Uhrbacteria bacterium]